MSLTHLRRHPLRSIRYAMSRPTAGSRIPVPRRSGRSWWSSPPYLPTDGRQPAATPRTLDELSAHWRLALFAAQDVLSAARAAGMSIGLRSDELGSFEHRLADERVKPRSSSKQSQTEGRDSTPSSPHESRATAQTLGLPVGVRACLFDLDGVLTASAEIHAAAWRDSFNDFLARRLELTGERSGPFPSFQHAAATTTATSTASLGLEGAHAFLCKPRDQAPGRASGRFRPRGNRLRPCEPKEQGLSTPARERRDSCVRGAIQYLDTAREAGMDAPRSRRARTWRESSKARGSLR